MSRVTVLIKSFIKLQSVVSFYSSCLENVFKEIHIHIRKEITKQFKMYCSHKLCKILIIKDWPGN